jgi:hypothetical protein
MIRNIQQTLALLVLLSSAVAAAPAIAQSAVINFPVNGRVMVEAREEVGRFPQMVFTSQRTHKQLILSSIEDKDKWLIPLEGDTNETRPSLRFRALRSRAFASPIIMAVAVYYGGSDHAFFLTLFTELNGKIIRLNEEPFFTNIQGGYYFGTLNQRFGRGLAVWNFVWDDGRGHYSNHKYQIDIYRLRGGKLRRIFKTTSRRTYNPGKGENSLRELGIKAYDQRAGIPRIEDAIK